MQHRIDDDSLRSLTKKDLTTFVQLVESLLGHAMKEGETESEVYRYSEMIELELALKCLSMPILEKKFIGHAILA